MFCDRHVPVAEWRTHPHNPDRVTVRSVIFWATAKAVGAIAKAVSWTPWMAGSAVKAVLIAALVGFVGLFSLHFIQGAAPGTSIRMVIQDVELIAACPTGGGKLWRIINRSALQGGIIELAKALRIPAATSATTWSLCSASPSTAAWPATMIPTMQNVFPKTQP